MNSAILDFNLVRPLVYILYYFKMLPLIWWYFDRRIKDILFLLFYQLLIATVSQGIYIFFYGKYENLFYPMFVYELCELGTAFLITILLLLGLFFRKNNILKIYFGELTLFQYVLFCITLFIADFMQVSIIVLFCQQKFFKVLSMLNILAICILMVHLMLVRESDVRKGKVIDILDEQMDKLTGYYNEVIELETQTKKFRHDIKNLLLVLHSLVESGENEKALEYIEKMSDICKKTTNKYDTGNFVADTLLSAKSTVAESIETDIEFKGFIPSEMGNVDLVILLSNILDNALEACEKIKGRKTIVIESILQKHLWILIVQNPTENIVKIKRNQIETTKSNKEMHGFGIQNMERVTQKYNGSITLECKEGVFTAKAMLQLKRI